VLQPLLGEDALGFGFEFVVAVVGLEGPAVLLLLTKVN
jgi:hypothetical protein